MADSRSTGRQGIADGRPFYDEFAWSYDMLVGDPVEPWVEAVDEVIRSQAGSHPLRVLDAGCGTGRHGASLAARGYLVSLLDAEESMLAQARARCPGSTAYRADLRGFELGESFPAITCRGVLNDLLSDADRSAAISALAHHLETAGVLILDVRDRDRSHRRYLEPSTIRRRVEIDDGELLFTSQGVWEDELLVFDERHELHVRGRDPVVAARRFVMNPWSPAELHERLEREGLTDVSIRRAPDAVRADRLFVSARCG